MFICAGAGLDTHNTLIQRGCQCARGGNIQWYTTTLQENVLKFLKVRFGGWHVPSENSGLRERFLDFLGNAYIREEHELFNQTVRFAH